MKYQSLKKMTSVLFSTQNNTIHKNFECNTKQGMDMHIIKTVLHTVYTTDRQTDTLTSYVLQTECHDGATMQGWFGTSFCLS